LLGGSGNPNSTENGSGMKRSSAIRLVLMGSAALALAACDEKVPAGVFENAERCSVSGQYSREQCNAAFADAQREHMRTAPRFESQAECETQFGPNQCQRAPESQTAAANNGGHSIFMPLMMGYMLGNMMGGPGYMSQPLYRPAGSQTYYSAAGTGVATGPGKVNVSQAAFKPQASAVGSVSRGGFGSSARSFGSIST
jgi:uncharacterized protein YgiB involved in biofilm formation